MNNKLFKLLKKSYNLNGIDKDQILILVKENGSFLYKEVYTKEFTQALKKQLDHEFKTGQMNIRPEDVAECPELMFAQLKDLPSANGERLKGFGKGLLFAGLVITTAGVIGAILDSRKNKKENS